MVFNEDEVRELLRKQVDACSKHFEQQTYPLRSVTGNPHTQKWIRENLHTIIKQTPIVKI